MLSQISVLNYNISVWCWWPPLWALSKPYKKWNSSNPIWVHEAIGPSLVSSKLANLNPFFACSIFVLGLVKSNIEVRASEVRQDLPKLYTTKYWSTQYRFGQAYQSVAADRDLISTGCWDSLQPLGPFGRHWARQLADLRAFMLLCSLKFWLFSMLVSGWFFADRV